MIYHVQLPRPLGRWISAARRDYPRAILMSIAPLPHGTLLNLTSGGSPYRIERVLGRGGFGITYLAEWMGAQVAIKEYLPEDFALRAEDGLGVLPRPGKLAQWFQFGRERFEAEARTLLQLKDAPSIAKALNFFAAHGTAYLVMDYVLGRTLEQLCDERGALPEPELRNVLELMVRSLAVVHERGYLHRDIKPANIVMVGDGRPVLIDFGAARQALLAQTQVLTVILSPGYAPFEQYNTTGSGPYSDFYSLGATLYRAILPEPPRQACQRMIAAQATDRVAALQAGRSDPLEPAARVGAGRYSVEFLQVLDWMLEVWPANRPQAAQALLERLQAGEGRPARGKRSPPALRPRWGADRNMIAGLALITVAGMVALVSNLLTQPESPTQVAAAPEVSNFAPFDVPHFWWYADTEDSESEMPASFTESQQAAIFSAAGQEREISAAATRDATDVLGVQIGFSYAQLEQQLRSKAVRWREGLPPDTLNSAEYLVNLADGSTAMVRFASELNERRVMALYYEQRLRDGPLLQDMLESLTKKYGVPDRDHDFKGGRTLTWWLRSKAQGEPKGAALRARLQQSADGRVAYLRLTLKDEKLILDDAERSAERAAAASRARRSSSGPQSATAQF